MGEIDIPSYFLGKKNGGGGGGGTANITYGTEDLTPRCITTR